LIHPLSKGTLEKATDGKVILDGIELTSVPEKIASRREKRKIGFIDRSVKPLSLYRLSDNYLW